MMAFVAAQKVRHSIPRWFNGGRRGRLKSILIDHGDENKIEMQFGIEPFHNTYIYNTEWQRCERYLYVLNLFI